MFSWIVIALLRFCVKNEKILLFFKGDSQENLVDVWWNIDKKKILKVDLERVRCSPEFALI